MFSVLVIFCMMSYIIGGGRREYDSKGFNYYNNIENITIEEPPMSEEEVLHETKETIHSLYVSSNSSSCNFIKDPNICNFSNPCGFNCSISRVNYLNKEESQHYFRIYFLPGIYIFSKEIVKSPIKVKHAIITILPLIDNSVTVKLKKRKLQDGILHFVAVEDSLSSYFRFWGFSVVGMNSEQSFPLSDFAVVLEYSNTVTYYEFYDMEFLNVSLFSINCYSFCTMSVDKVKVIESMLNNSIVAPDYYYSSKNGKVPVEWDSWVGWRFVAVIQDSIFNGMFYSYEDRISPSISFSLGGSHTNITIDGCEFQSPFLSPFLVVSKHRGESEVEDSGVVLIVRNSNFQVDLPESFVSSYSDLIHISIYREANYRRWDVGDVVIVEDCSFKNIRNYVAERRLSLFGIKIVPNGDGTNIKFHNNSFESNINITLINLEVQEYKEFVELTFEVSDCQFFGNEYFYHSPLYKRNSLIFLYFPQPKSLFMDQYSDADSQYFNEYTPKEHLNIAIVVDSCSFGRNRAGSLVSVISFFGYFLNSESTQDETTIFSFSSTVVLSNSIFEENFGLENLVELVLLEFGTTWLHHDIYSSFNVSGCQFIRNRVDGDSVINIRNEGILGEIVMGCMSECNVFGECFIVVIESTRFIQNSERNIHIKGILVLLDSIEIEGFGNDDVDKSSLDGFGIYSQNAILEIRKSSFYNLRTSGNGAALFFIGGKIENFKQHCCQDNYCPKQNHLRIINSNFSTNFANFGGSMFIENSASIFLHGIQNCNGYAAYGGCMLILNSRIVKFEIGNNEMESQDFSSKALVAGNLVYHANPSSEIIFESIQEIYRDDVSYTPSTIYLEDDSKNRCVFIEKEMHNYTCEMKGIVFVDRVNRTVRFSTPYEHDVVITFYDNLTIGEIPLKGQNFIFRSIEGTGRIIIDRYADKHKVISNDRKTIKMEIEFMDIVQSTYVHFDLPKKSPNIGEFLSIGFLSGIFFVVCFLSILCPVLVCSSITCCYYYVSLKKRKERKKNFSFYDFDLPLKFDINDSSNNDENVSLLQNVRKVGKRHELVLDKDFKSGKIFFIEKSDTSFYPGLFNRKRTLVFRGTVLWNENDLSQTNEGKDGILYHIDGVKKKFVGKFDMYGKPSGIVTKYDRKGKKLHEGLYRDGNLVRIIDANINIPFIDEPEKERVKELFENMKRGIVVMDERDKVVEIGKGGYSNIFKYYHLKRREFVALKILKSRVFQSDEDKINYQRDLEVSFKVTKLLDHPNIIQTYEFSKDPPFYFMELCDCNMMDVIVEYRKNKMQMSVRKKVGFLQAVVSAMIHIHGNGYTHRDLKWTNVFLDKTKMIPKVSDLDSGKSRIKEFYRYNDNKTKIEKDERIEIRDNEELDFEKENIHTKHPSGTFFYAAPELFINIKSPSLKVKREEELRYSHKCDLFSFGIMTWELMSMRFVNFGIRKNRCSICKEEIKMPKSVKELDLEFQTNLSYHIYVCGIRPDLNHYQNDSDGENIEWIKEMNNKCWRSDPKERISFEEIERIIKNNISHFS